MTEPLYIVEFKILDIKCQGKAYFDLKKNKEIYKTGLQRVIETWEKESYNSPIKVDATILESRTTGPGKPKGGDYTITVMGVSELYPMSVIQKYKTSVIQIANAVKREVEQEYMMKISFTYVNENQYIYNWGKIMNNNLTNILEKYKKNKNKFIYECCYSLSKTKKDTIKDNYKILEHIFSVIQVSYGSNLESSIYSLCFTIMALILTNMNVSEVTNTVDLYFNKVMERLNTNNENIFDINF